VCAICFLVPCAQYSNTKVFGIRMCVTLLFELPLYYSHLSDNIYKIKKRIIRIITNSGRRDSCCDLYKKLQILPLPSQYIFSLLVFVNNNRSCFISNCAVHDINTCHNHNLHLPSTSLSLVQKGVLFSGSKIYNHLPLNIKMLSKDTKRFKSTIRTYLTEHDFYTLEEYYQLSS
jgi:hypothetical protein